MTKSTLTVAAVADIHYGTDSAGHMQQDLALLEERADVFLIAGDLTRHGDPDEAAVLAEDIRSLTLPVVAVLGNHDYHADQEQKIAAFMEEAGAIVLEGTHTTIDIGGRQLGIAGTKGFGGGFAGACGSNFGEPEMKAFVQHTSYLSDRLASALASLERADHRIALLHYSPVEATLEGERLEIFPFLGSYLLGEAIDSVGADLALHGHAHAGKENGETPGGATVRNVSMPVIGKPYELYQLKEEGLT